MAHPRYKGPRDPVLLRLPKADKELLKQRAQRAGLDYSEYVMALVRRDPVDDSGRPAWAPDSQQDETLPLAM